MQFLQHWVGFLQTAVCWLHRVDYEQTLAGGAEPVVGKNSIRFHRLGSILHNNHGDSKWLQFVDKIVELQKRFTSDLFFW